MIILQGHPGEKGAEGAVGMIGEPVSGMDMYIINMFVCMHNVHECIIAIFIWLNIYTV